MMSSFKPSLRPHKLPGQAVRRLLFSLISLLFLFAAPSSSAQQQAADTVNKQSPENQQPSSIKAGTEGARTGSIPGRVISDDGRPLANVAIFVYGLGATARPSQTTTDADGKFRLENLRPGAYGIGALTPGYVRLPDAGALAGSTRYYHIGESVTLTMVKGGVITGTVTNTDGEPIVATAVRAIRVRQTSERQTASFNFVRDGMTDDRGVYRLYGLEPGVYVLAVGGSFSSYSNLNAYDGDTPTYYPSATRDTAAELTVRANEELTSIDVRYRGERGHSVSGFLSGSVGGEIGSRSNWTSITLLRTASGTPEAYASVGGEGSTRSFAMNGIADGDYTLMAMGALDTRNDTGGLTRAIRKISVRGTDVTGVELKLEPLGSVTGNVLLEQPPAADCKNQRGSSLEELVVNARSEEKEKTEDRFLSAFRGLYAAPNNKGEFKLLNLQSGSYRLETGLPGDDWYVRSVALPGTIGNARPTPQSKTPPGSFTLKPGEQLNGLTVTIGQGAANLRGRVASSTEGANLPASLRVYLVPTEAERAADPLRYMEAAVERDATFALNNIAPGRYWLIARAVAIDESERTTRRPVALESVERGLLRREAESAGVKIDLQPCQRLADYVLNYGAAPKPPIVK